MSYATVIVPILRNVVGGRLYPDVPPDGVAYPCAFYQRVGGNDYLYLENGIPAKEHSRVRLWVWARARLEADSIMSQMREALVNSNERIEIYGSPTSDYESNFKLFGCHWDFGIWTPIP